MGSLRYAPGCGAGGQARTCLVPPACTVSGPCTPAVPVPWNATCLGCIPTRDINQALRRKLKVFVGVRQYYTELYKEQEVK